MGCSRFVPKFTVEDGTRRGKAAAPVLKPVNKV